MLAEDSDKGENGEIKENLDGSRVYDGTSVDLTPSTDGDGARSYIVENTETGDVLTTDPVNVGEYRVVYRVSEGKNYTEGSVSYDFAITQAPLVITAEDKNVVFGAKAPEYTVVYDGFVNGETEAVLTGTLVVITKRKAVSILTRSFRPDFLQRTTRSPGRMAF
ncbi:MAG: hypothetical protein BHV91_04345 [Clostridiales bacterium 44_9]|nr:MAG: hypothetical protein BHV91_04345 [Clostridiales bacterium 44_9]